MRKVESEDFYIIGVNKQLNNTNIQGFENSDIKKQFSDTEVSNAYNINPEAANFEPASSTKKATSFR